MLTVLKKDSIPCSWRGALKGELDKPYFQSLDCFLAQELSQKKELCPRPSLFFEALSLTSVDQVKVVILGQDPYHGFDQAHGLSFSVPQKKKLPPSLKNIFKELSDDLRCPLPRSGLLVSWAEQGVLLLNSILSVRAHSPASHSGKGWEMFTDKIISHLSGTKKHLVFLLWGSYAQSKGASINRSKHLVLQAPHPSPFSVHRGFFSCKHFSKTNNYLEKHGKNPIDWRLQ